MLLILSVIQVLLIVLALILLLTRNRRDATAELAERVSELRTISEHADAAIRDELRMFRTELTDHWQGSRQEAATEGRLLREEVVTSVDRFGSQTNDSIAEFRREQSQGAMALKDSVEQSLVRLGGGVRETSSQLSEAVREKLAEVARGVTDLTSSNEQKLEIIRQDVTSLLGALKDQLGSTSTQLLESVRSNLSLLGSDLRDTNRQVGEAIQQRLSDLSAKFEQLSNTNQQSQEAVRQTLETRLDKLSEVNSQKLDEMRQTVDEKLHSTLERRLTDSFGLVTEQLGLVQRGLGEMKELANGVGDLKRVLTNVKTRGGYGEVQLESLLDQMLAPEQFAKNVAVRSGSQERVEFAVKFPGPDDGHVMFLPVDAKFPRETWERLQDAQSSGDPEAVKDAAAELERAIRSGAKAISDKYINPPETAPFAVMFLATEGLFAEVVRRPGLVDELQTKFHICIAGPTTFAAILTSLQMGFRTLAIQRKGNEIWKILAATKVEFANFGALMDTVERQVGTVQNTLKKVNTKARTINRKLKDVETLDLEPAAAAALLGTSEIAEEEAAAEEFDIAASAERDKALGAAEG